ncbi:MAG: DUF4956 domain-containing protein [candidate division KSB1 bacterium]|nr:DUF4956 domain-containing protein [candidate division KSB1 bacterium]MDZ7377495.1 DUF4956 domain-containing protein [candidate division KSB1 bacterium]MDZ7402125.1 DUF4956 domain-containing protein [candidate division KSB1 bacterium]
MQTLLNYGFEQIEWPIALMSFLMAFLLSSLIAITYERTFQGLSYSRGLVQSMVLGSLVSCLLMIAIGDNIARGIGIVGSLAIIRFRTNLRDPRDLVFLFASLGVGVASGVQSYVTAVIGALMFCLVVFVLYISPFGTRRKHDGLVRFQIPTGPQAANEVTSIMQNYTKNFVLVAMRSVAQGQVVDYAYQVKLADPDDNIALIQQLERIDGIRGITYTNQEATVEV